MSPFPFHSNYTVPGAYSDNDMLECCNGNMSAAEYRAQFSTFAIQTSPLILGNDLRGLTADCVAVIGNKEVIAINQDARVSRARLVYQWPLKAWPNRTSFTPFAEPSPDALPASPLPPPSNSPGLKEMLETRLCSQTDPSQRFVLGPDRTIRAAVESGATGTPATSCLSYLGFMLDNVGMAACSVPQGHADPSSQQWAVANNGTGTGTIRPIGSLMRSLNVQGCAAGAAVNMAVTKGDCPRGDCQSDQKSHGKCGAGCGAGVDTRTFAVVAADSVGSGTPPADPHDVGVTRRTAVLLQSMLPGASKLCVARVTPAPSPYFLNITVQVWAKPLADGSFAVVAFNRGGAPVTVAIPWEMIGIGGLRTPAKVRDLWAHEDFFAYIGGLQLRRHPVPRRLRPQDQ